MDAEEFKKSLEKLDFIYGGPDRDNIYYAMKN